MFRAGHSIGTGEVGAPPPSKTVNKV
jgi:hypothetical protein